MWCDNVFHVVMHIPPGYVMTYAQVARAAGKPRAARAVGNALTTNRDTRRVPCHRVVRSDGRVGGYAFGDVQKIERLRNEGIAIQRGRIINMQSVLWEPA